MHENYLNCIEGKCQGVEYKRGRFRSISDDMQSRLSPEGATGFMLGTIFYISIFMFIIFVGDLNYCNNLLIEQLLKLKLCYLVFKLYF